MMRNGVLLCLWNKLLSLRGGEVLQIQKKRTPSQQGTSVGGSKRTGNIKNRLSDQAKSSTGRWMKIMPSRG